MSRPVFVVGPVEQEFTGVVIGYSETLGVEFTSTDTVWFAKRYSATDYRMDPMSHFEWQLPLQQPEETDEAFAARYAQDLANLPNGPRTIMAWAQANPPVQNPAEASVDGSALHDPATPESERSDAGRRLEEWEVQEKRNKDEADDLEQAVLNNPVIMGEVAAHRDDPSDVVE